MNTTVNNTGTVEAPVETYLVVVRASPGDASPPIAVRLRRWLKLGLRSFGLRALRIEPVATLPEEIKNLPLEVKLAMIEELRKMPTGKPRSTACNKKRDP